MKKLLLLFLLTASAADAAPRDDRERVNYLAYSAKIVVVAEVLGVEKSPGHNSESGANVQDVRYRVIAVLKGELKYPELRVEFLLFQENPFVDPFEPHLLPEVFKAGNRQVHFLKRRDEGVYFDNNRRRFEFFSSFDHIWSAPTAPNTVNRIRQLVLMKQNAKR